MKIFWDTSLTSDQYPSHVKKIFYKNYISKRKKYTDWIGKLGRKNNNQIDWWTTTPVTRDSYKTDIYKSICILETLQKFQKKNVYFEIIVESNNLKKIITKWFINTGQNFKITSKNNFNSINNFFLLAKSIIFNFIIYLLINFWIKKKKIEKKIVLLNTYATLNKFEPERLYKFEKYLSKNKIKDSYFVPTFISTKNFFKLWAVIKILNKKNYIFKEHYLTLKDYFLSIFHFYRVKKFTGNFPKYKNWKLDLLINEEIKSLKGSSSKLICVLNYYFIKRLSEKKINLKKSISWLENESDKAWNFGIRKFYPHVKTLGYQGFANLPQLMNTIPTKYENDAKFIPEKIIVIGRAYKNCRKEFFKKLKVVVGPALVYEDLFLKKNKKKKYKFLLVLTDFKDMNSYILNFLIENQCIFEKSKLMIKLPKILKFKYIKLFNKLPSNFILTNKKLSDLLKISENVICAGGTSVTIEALAYNCYLIVPEIDICDKYNLQMLKIPKNRFSIVPFGKNFLNKIKILKNRKLKLKNSEFLKSKLFTKPNISNLRLFY